MLSIATLTFHSLLIPNIFVAMFLILVLTLIAYIYTLNYGLFLLDYKSVLMSPLATPKV